VHPRADCFGLLSRALDNDLIVNVQYYVIDLAQRRPQNVIGCRLCDVLAIVNNQRLAVHAPHYEPAARPAVDEVENFLLASGAAIRSAPVTPCEMRYSSVVCPIPVASESSHTSI